MTKLEELQKRYRKIMSQFGNQVGNIPIGHEYWQIAQEIRVESARNKDEGKESDKPVIVTSKRLIGEVAPSIEVKPEVEEVKLEIKPVNEPVSSLDELFK